MSLSFEWSRSRTALGVLAAGLLVALAAPAQAQTHVDNPFLGASMYVNPDFTAKAEAAAAVSADRELAAQMRVVGAHPTAVWLDRVEAVPNLATHLDRALAAGNDLALFVLYDMPGRGCDDLASDGELPLSDLGLATYKSQFIDPIAAIASQPKYAGIRIVFIVEPDSLASLVTGLSSIPCAEAQASGRYVSAVQYAVNQLHAIPNVYLYLDLAYASWLGWAENASRMVTLLSSVAAGFADGKDALDGFSTNVGDYVPVDEPFLTASTIVNGQPVSSARFYQYNSDIDDASYAADMWARLTAAGWPATIGMIGDTSRSGWGGARRPSGPSLTVTDLEKFVNESRVDRRTTRSAWCNQSGAGLGERPQAAPTGYAASHYDAFAWVKTPGVSDGTAEDNRWCDPTFVTPEGVFTGALPSAPAKGEWFPALFAQLVQNMWPTITGEPPSYKLTVIPNDLGLVTSTPAGIDCGATCSASFLSGTQVTLTVAGITDSMRFLGWTGACAGAATPTCVVSMIQAQTVGTNFARPFPLVVETAGAGTVTSNVGGIDCPTACSGSFTSTTIVTLTAKAASGSSFAGWSGACSGAKPTCTVSMSAARSVTATFQPGTWYLLDVLVSQNVCNPPPGCLPEVACPAVCYGGNAVTSSPAGIDCGNGGACSAAYASGTSVTLTAIPYGDNVFAGWLGPCAGSTARTCVVPMTVAQSVTARFVASNLHTLRVSRAGTGTGSVTGGNGAIDCGTTCSASFTSGTIVTLTATAAKSSTFTGWTGGGCSGTSLTCAVTMNTEQYVTASFAAVYPSYTLTVSRIIGGMGSGSVTSSPAGIDCGATCAAKFSADTIVVLTATPASGSTFSGWGGACVGATGNTCKVTMTADLTASAAFAAPTSFPLAVTKAGLGAGTVVSSPAGIQCGTTCTASFIAGSSVTLTAAPASGSVFAGWSGACTGTSAICVVPMTRAQSVIASFGGPNPIFSVAKAGTGAGRVVSTPAGIDCGSVCIASIPANSVTLTATAAAGSTFTGWSGGGGCTGTAATCVVTADPISQRVSAIATFDLAPGTPCANPITFSWNSGNFDTTSAACYRTSQRVNGWGCANFAGRTVRVNDGAATATCGAGPFPLGKAADGYTYFAVTAGQYPYASLYVW